MNIAGLNVRSGEISRQLKFWVKWFTTIVADNLEVENLKQKQESTKV